MSDSIGEAVAAFDPAIPFDRAWTPPSRWYTDPAFYQRERGAVFGRTWQLAARAAQVESPGDYVTTCIAGEPWVVVRGEDGALRAFANTCRHKATVVARGAGNLGAAGELVCTYHGWAYGLDGRLKRAPQLGRVRDFERAGLPELRAERWGPYVFVSADPQAPSLAAQLAPLDRALSDTGWADLRYRTTRTWDIACNWKVFCDNYLDGGYHIAHRHPTLDAQLDLSSYRTRVFDRFSLQSSEPGGQDARVDFDPGERIAGGALYAFVYPNLMLNRYGPVLDTNFVIPLGPDRCRVFFDFFFEDGTDEDFIETSMAQSDLTQEEDVEVSESVQIGLNAASYDRGRYAEIEIAVHHFHCLLAADLGG